MPFNTKFFRSNLAISQPGYQLIQAKQKEG